MATEATHKRKRSPASRVTPAKITPPRLGECLDRQRLFHRLDRFRDKPAVWISGPAGCGKTVLAESYLKAADIPHLWYQIDARDADPATLFYYLGLAVKRKAPHRREVLPLLTAEYLGGVQAFTRNFFEALYGRLNSPFILVFDNCQDLADDTIFSQVIRDAVEVLPDGGRIILISRSEPPKILARLQLHQDMAMLGWEDLRLTLDEVKGLARILHKEELSDEQVTAMCTKTLGWTAGVVLLLSQSRKTHLTLDDDSLSAPESIFDYFAGEILAELDGATRDFLIKSAFLPQINPAAARSLTGNKNAGSILADLVSRNYFTYQCSHRKDPLYQYHPLFGEFLREQAQIAMDRNDFQNLQIRAARILLENGLYEAGAKLLHATSEWDRLSHLICDQAHFLVSQGRFGTLQEWLNYLPEEKTMNTPWLIYWLAVCRMPFEPAESHEYFEKAYVLFKEGEDLHGVFLSWSGAVDAIHFHMAELGQLDYWIDELENLIKNHQQFPSRETETRVTTSMLRSLVWRQPQNPRIKYWEKRAVFLWEHVSDLNSRLQLGPTLIQYYYFLGRQKEAHCFIKPLGRLAQSANANPLTKIIARTMNGYHHWPLGNNPSVMRWADEALRLANQTGIHVWDCLILGINIFAALCSVRKDATDGLLDKMAKVLEQRVQNTDTAFYYFLLSWRTGLEKENAPAVDHAVKALKIVRQHGAVFPEALCRYALSWSYFDQGKVKQAHSNLRKVQGTALATKSYLLKFSCLVAQAYFFLSESRQQRGLEVLSQAFSLGRERGFEQIFYWRQEPMAFLCAAALSHEIEISYVRRLIRRHNLFPGKPSVAVRHWPWVLNVVTLGRFEVVIDDKPIDAACTPGKPLMLLKALIAFGGHNVKEMQLSEALWPGVERDAARAVFNKTLQRLRELIGHESAIILKDRKLSLDFKQCRIDLQALHQCLDAAAVTDTHPTEDTPTLRRLAREILKIYQGPFLLEEDAPWVIGLRDRLQTKTLRVLKAIGAHLEIREQWSAAVALYERATEFDPVAEDFYQGMMRCHASSGRPAEALAAYQKCREMISRMLGVEPSARTESLRHKIMSAENPHNNGSALTPKETEVLKWVAQGKSTWEISKILEISERTVKFHVGNILRKLDAVTRTHAVAIALEKGLVKIE